MNIVKHKIAFFIISLVIILPGLVSLSLWGLKLSIDFTGGSRLVLLFEKPVDSQTKRIIEAVFSQQHHEVVSIQTSKKQVVIRATPLDQPVYKKIILELQNKAGKFHEEEFATTGPSIGQETTINAIYGLLLASLLIIFYLAWSFRQVPKPASSWRFGVCAVLALIHDVIILFGIFSLLGHFFGVEINSLFVTAVLTVVGFSVHDTIVVFDRIRENLRRQTQKMSFSAVVNQSMLQTLTRSINTSLTVVLVLVTMLLFGGESIRWFIVALLVGIISGTYSSIFNASLLLVVWHDWKEKKMMLP